MVRGDTLNEISVLICFFLNIINLVPGFEARVHSHAA